MTLQINLEEAEINYILTALGNRPFVEVMELIPKIQQQAKAQLEPKKKEPK